MSFRGAERLLRPRFFCGAPARGNVENMLSKLTQRDKIKGFTLIELLIVVSVIGILSGLAISVINPSALRAKARDSQRISDLKKVQAALEIYFTDSRHYPTVAVPTSYYLINSALAGLVPNYISQLPSDPAGYASSFSCSSNFGYSYRTDSTGSRYALLAKMETTSADYVRCSGISNCGDSVFDCNNCTEAQRCHATQNPL